MRSNVRRCAVAVVGLALTVGLQGCGFINELRSKNVLNEGVRTFNRGKYDEAQDMFEQALAYDPDNKNAKFFYAMALNARYEKARNSQSADKAETIELGKKTVDAFNQVIEAGGSHDIMDRAYAFIANTYKTMAEQVYDPKDEAAQVADARAKYLEFIQKRADMPEQDARTKAQMYYTLADHYWRSAREAILPFEKKDPYNPAAPATYDPIPPDKQPQVMADIAKAHEYNQKAIQTDAAYPEPYIGEKLVYMEEIKLVGNDQEKRAQIKTQVDQWDEKYRDKLSAQQAAEAAAPAEDATKGAGQ
jgi:tetratricopeptide (TPR) repeat protein